MMILKKCDLRTSMAAPDLSFRSLNSNIILLIHKADGEKYFDIEYVEDKYYSIDENDDEGSHCVFALCCFLRTG